MGALMHNNNNAIIVIHLLLMHKLNLHKNLIQFTLQFYFYTKTLRYNKVHYALCNKP